MRKTIREMIEVMEAFERGEPIEAFYHSENQWRRVRKPIWNWLSCDYRVAITPDYIDWSHVNPMYNYMARDKTGDVFLYSKRPELEEFIWHPRDSISCCLQTGSYDVNPFTSYKKGTVSWDKSLVERPS